MKKIIMLLALTFSLALCVSASSSKTVMERTQEQVEAPKITLHQAVIMNNLDVIKKHILAGSDLNVIEQQGGSTALITAAAFGNYDAAKLLIDAGADLNLKNNDGSTALHTSAFFCREEIVQLLLDNGADLSLKNNYGNTALESVQAPFDKVKPVYDAIGKAMKPIGIVFDYDNIKKTRPVIVEMIKSEQNLKDEE